MCIYGQLFVTLIIHIVYVLCWLAENRVPASQYKSSVTLLAPGDMNLTCTLTLS